jgi:prepilin-type N-terminal cleavage/methylation domain-containing protein
MEVNGMTKQECRTTNENAFTLLELLVVIAIIAVLAGLLFPVGQSVLERAKKVQAKNDLTELVIATNAFYTEYGRYPTAQTIDASAIYGPGHLKNDVVLNELRARSSVLNTRQIVFFSPAEDTNQLSPKGKIGIDGQFYDPWGSAYSIAIDADYDNQVTNPYTADTGAGPAAIRQGVISWSIGKDKTQGTSFNTSDDVISWQ